MLLIWYKILGPAAAKPWVWTFFTTNSPNVHVPSARDWLGNKFVRYHTQNCPALRNTEVTKYLVEIGQRLAFPRQRGPFFAQLCILPGAQIVTQQWDRVVVWRGGSGRDGCPKDGQAKWTLPLCPHSSARRFLCQDTSDFSEDDVSYTAQLCAGLHRKTQSTSCSCQWLVWNMVVGLPPHKTPPRSPRGTGTGTILLHTENISRDLFPVQIEWFWLPTDSALYIFTNRIIAAFSSWWVLYLPHAKGTRAAPVGQNH